jgi:hypothetical protein
MNAYAVRACPAGFPKTASDLPVNVALSIGTDVLVMVAAWNLSPAG